jgi:hypothetical protein
LLRTDDDDRRLSGSSYESSSSSDAGHETAERQSHLGKIAHTMSQHGIDIGHKTIMGATLDTGMCMLIPLGVDSQYRIFRGSSKRTKRLHKLQIIS